MVKIIKIKPNEKSQKSILVLLQYIVIKKFRFVCNVHIRKKVIFRFINVRLLNIFKSFRPTPFLYPRIQGFHEMAKSYEQNLRYFRANLFANFCAIFAQIAQNRKYFFAKVAHDTKFQFCAIFLCNLRKTASFTQNVTFQSNCQKLIF